MHDIDRIRHEMEQGIDALESTGFEVDEYAGEVYGESGTSDEFEFEFEFEGVFNEQQELELASELLEVTTDAELNQFIGKLIKRAGKAVGKAVRSPIGRSLGGLLKGAAKTALPMAGAALGNMVVPGLGGMVGGQLASAAGSAFGLELEGLSSEDREFEVARRYVRLAGDATRRAVSAPPNANPAQVAQAAVTGAAKTHAPGLAARGSRGARANGAAPSGSSSGQTGRWFRRGRKIILVGA